MEKTRHFIVDTPVGQLAIYAKHDKTDCAADYAAGSMPIRLTQLTSSLGRRILSVSQRKTALAIASWRLPKRSQRAVLWLMQVMVRSSV